MTRTARTLSMVAIAGWLASLLLPALSFRFDGEHDQILSGYKVLTSGFMHLFVLELSWLANFVFWFLVWCIWKRSDRRRTIIVSTAAMLLLTAQSGEIFLWSRFFEYPRAYPGYYFWVGSNVLQSVAAVLTVFGSLRRKLPSVLAADR